MKSMIIVGAGIGGLSAGCYAQMNGYKTRILEMHNLPGGCCTSWKRKGYTFDLCIEWLLGTGHGNVMNQIWQELGALKGKRITNFDVFSHVKGIDGRMISFYVDPDRLEQHLKEISPEDKKPIEEFCNGLRTFTKINLFRPLLKPFKLMNLFEIIKVFLELCPYFKTIGLAEEIQMADFADRFKDPLLRQAFKYIFFQDQITFPLLPFYMNVACATNKNAGFPEGGSLGFARSIEKRYKTLGGEIQYDTRVKKIIVKGDSAVGVVLQDGTEQFADIVISACDGRTTIFDMLDGKYVDETIETLYNKLIDEPHMIYPGVVSTFLGVKREVKGEPHSVTYFLDDAEAARLPAVLQSSIVVQHRSLYSPEFSPPGKSVLLGYYYSEYDYWKKLYEDKDAYYKEKQKVSDFVIEYLDKIYPNLKDQVEVIDVSTPVTLMRYTGNFKGSVMAWKPLTKAEDLTKKMIKKDGMKLPGLKNFYITGQWVSVGGLIRVASWGRHVIQFVCKNDKKKFTAWVD